MRAWVWMVLAALCLVPSAGWAWIHGKAIVSPKGPWQSLNVGAGGRITGLSVTSDNRLLARVDVFGAYQFNAGQGTGVNGGVWALLLNSTSMNSWLNTGSNAGSPAVFAWNGGSSGVEEIVAAPSNPQHLYMWWQRGTWFSTDRGNTWTQTSPSIINCNCDASNTSPYKNYGQKIAVDPNNENVALVGSGTQGLYLTTDGGTTYCQIAAASPSGACIGSSGFPTSTAGGGVFAIVYDPSGANGAVSPTSGACPGSTCRTNVVYATPWNGGSASRPYVSVNGGKTWTQVTATGAPTFQVNYGKIASDGTLIVTDDNNGTRNTVWNYTPGNPTVSAGTWSNTISGSGWGAIAIDPFTSGASTRIVAISANGNINISTNKGSTWSGVSNNSTFSYPDFPWLATGVASFISTHTLEFDQSTQNKLWTCGGSGCLYLTGLGSVSTGQTFTFTGNSYGIQNLVSMDVLVPPGGSNVIVTAEDKWLFTTPINNTGNATLQTLGLTATGLATGWNIDYASSNTSFVYVPVIGQIQNGPPPQSLAWSPDGGATWKVMGTDTAPVACGGSATTIPPEQLLSSGHPYVYQGIIAASSPCNLIYAPALRQPWYTTDGGATWNRTSLATASSGVIADTAYASITAGWALNATSVDLTGSGVSCSSLSPGMAVVASDVSNGTAAVVANPACTGSSVKFTTGISRAGTAGQHLYFSYYYSGGGANTGLAQQTFNYKSVVADRVNANVFYMFYGGSGFSASPPAQYGVYKTTDGGATWTQISHVALNAVNHGLVSVPGQAGNLFMYSRIDYSNGGTYGTPSAHPKSNDSLWFLQDNGGTGQAWTKVPNVAETSAFCIGKAPAIGSYPSLYVLGYVSGVYGLWRSINFSPSNVAGTTWTKIDSGYPNGAAMVTSCSASMDSYGSIYVTTDNYNWVWGLFP